MELSFEIIKIIEKINKNPESLVIFAAFHGFAILIGIPLLLIPLKKIGIYTPKKKLSDFWFSIILIFFIGWIIGFITQMILLPLGVPGIKLLLIYISMYLCISTFVIYNIKKIQKQYLKITNKKN